MSTTASGAASDSITYLSQADAIAVDQELMGPVLGFSVDQLMELAGLSVACALAAEYPPDVSVCYPKPTDKPLYNGLIKQISSLGIPLVSWTDLQAAGPLSSLADVVVDALFGFSFSGQPRPPFDAILQAALPSSAKTLEVRLEAGRPLAAQVKALLPGSQPPFIVSVDIPSGWHVEQGPPGGPAAEEEGTALQPDMLVSLTAPKLCARYFKAGLQEEGGRQGGRLGGPLHAIPRHALSFHVMSCPTSPNILHLFTAHPTILCILHGAHHYLGGRFVPPAIRDRFQLRLPPYPGTAACVRIGGGAAESAAAATAATAAKAVVAAAAATVAVQAKVADMRISYERGGLQEADFAGRDPLGVFDEWFKAAVSGKVCEEPNAISLATCDAQGRPSVRVVLLKGYDERGFIFYTNYASRKGGELATGFAAFSLYWEKLQRQIRVEGEVEKVSDLESTEYFHSRPRGSQIGAWVSNQSQPCRDRSELEARNTELQQRYSDESQPVPKPPHWGGYLIRPTGIEFWQGRPSRLHDRIRFRRATPSDSDPWVMERLQP
ncbi:hypothetical protein VOLCADRAFT_105746 [Volvox carteri f. nagariensis]|uniref:Pyridoxine-5'-phosphate oxidase n=1 Tax=Volvox carteri f. nagariensis TaxID=3068 RepID=D8U2S0_VOLCA|nr:uncharacterized protein VOLCADRAFT_105746 [Volvox carteri f. nagariensis]EFJ45948.1 hypothetical protein VOLCADRAFT_105746 [Volvox carteri f. nagariensis]|eukprot:XP_002953026.1 hypothetical protein VOLCADRAFT_105746 [Volvox carteri f. nagariensis]